MCSSTTRWLDIKWGLQWNVWFDPHFKEEETWIYQTKPNFGGVGGVGDDFRWKYNCLSPGKQPPN